MDSKSVMLLSSLIVGLVAFSKPQSLKASFNFLGQRGWIGIQFPRDQILEAQFIHPANDRFCACMLSCVQLFVT